MQIAHYVWVIGSSQYLVYLVCLMRNIDRQTDNHWVSVDPVSFSGLSSYGSSSVALITLSSSKTENAAQQEDARKTHGTFANLPQALFIPGDCVCFLLFWMATLKGIYKIPLMTSLKPQNSAFNTLPHTCFIPRLLSCEKSLGMQRY